MTNSSGGINSTQSSSSLYMFNFCVTNYPSEFIYYYSIATLCLVVGAPAHVWCLWFYYCAEWRSKPVQVLLLNHTFLELIFCAECLGEILNVLVFQNVTVNKGLMVFLCLAWFGRPLLQTCICVEQYLAVLHPVTFLRYKDVKFRIAAVASIYVFSFGYGLYMSTIMGFDELFFSLVFVITLTVISFCCVSVLRALKRSGPGEMRQEAGGGSGNLQKRNAFNVIFSALLIISLTYSPQVLIYILQSIYNDMTNSKCRIAPLLASINNIGVIITPLMKMYKEGHLKILFKAQ